MMFEIRCQSIETADPLLECRTYCLSTFLLQHLLGLGPGPIFPCLQGLQEFIKVGGGKGRSMYQRPVLRFYSPDTAVLLVPPRVKKINLSMLNDGIVPIGHINCTIRSNGNVHRTKSHMVCPHQVFRLLGGIAAALLLYRKSVDSVSPEVIGQKPSFPGFRKMPSRNYFKTAVFGLPGIQSPNDPLGTGSGDKGRARKSIINAFASRTVCQEGLSPAVELKPPGIDQTSGINIQ